MTGNSQNQSGFTLIEIVLVLSILGILAAIAIPKFIDLSEDAHDASTRATHGGFSSAVNIIHAEWLARGSSSVAVSPTGWPIGSGSPPMTHPRCTTVWTDILTSPPPATPGFSAGTDGWGALGSGNFCFYIYEPDTSPFRYIRYNVVNGLVEYFVF
jgi:prepilin-type N-terminal cleavage/methylation domain-containing protein